MNLMTNELKKILFIEDEPDIHTIIRYALEKRGGLTVHYCFSGKEALLVAESFSPDLILLDVMMPEMDGIATFQRLQQLPSLASTPIIFMTAKSQVSELAHYKQLSALDIITKPFNAVLLADQLRDIWKNYQETQHK